MGILSVEAVWCGGGEQQGDFWEAASTGLERTKTGNFTSSEEGVQWQKVYQNCDL